MGLRTDEEFMTRAIELASQGEGLVSPNPLVGAVVVKDGQVIGEGFHRFGLLRHAESYALEMAGTEASGAVLYCNLEPCSHQGRTPPCTVSVIQSGVSRVIIGMIDPDPRVNGRGVEQLKGAGVIVKIGVLESESDLLNEIYVKNVVRRAPFVHQVRFLDGVQESRDRWIPSKRMMRIALRYDALAMGSDDDGSNLLLAEFLKREWHRDPVVFADAESVETIRRHIRDSGGRRVMLAESPSSIHTGVDAGGASQGSREGESPEGCEPTSILTLAGAAVCEGLDIDKLTVICEASDESKAEELFSSISSKDQAGGFVELTGYPVARRE